MTAIEWFKLLLGPAITFLGVAFMYNRKMAVLEEKMTELTREVREHNNFAKRMPVLEERLDNLVDRVDEYHK